MADPVKTAAPAAAEPAKYKVTKPSYINDRYISEDEVAAGFKIFYSGIPGSALEPLNEAALQAKAGAPVPKEPAL